MVVENRSKRQRSGSGDVPESVRHAWEFSVFVLQQLAQALASGEVDKIFHVSFEFTAPTHASAIEGFSSEELLAWMKGNGYDEKVYELTFKSICRALAYDLLEFSTVAVNCSIDGALTVALALLRKPFKENLFYIEWILADREDFFGRFSSGDVRALTLGKLDATRKVQIIRAAMKTSPYAEWIEPEFLYELRFDKASPIGLEPTWQKANHLITTMGALRTEPENFNVVFSTDESRATQLRGFYATIPILLFHALQMIEALIGMFARRAEPDLVPLRTLAGLDLWMASESCVLDLSDIRFRIHQVVVRAIRRIRCLKCKHPFSVAPSNLHSAFSSGELHCLRCKWIMPLHYMGE